MSGITTTGSTIIINLNETTPKGILVWRAILQWLGGIGIILMAITLMPIMNVGGMQLLKISSNDASEKIFPKSKADITKINYNLFYFNFFMCIFLQIFWHELF